MRLTTFATASALALGAAGAAAEDLPYPESELIYKGSETVTGEPIDFPQDGDEVQAVIVSIAPGAATEWHRHGVPLFVYILEGEVRVTYEALGEKTYAAGEAFMEAMGEAHSARNEGDQPVRILAVYMAGDGGALATAADAPAE